MQIVHWAVELTVIGSESYPILVHDRVACVQAHGGEEDMYYYSFSSVGLRAG